MSKSQTSKMTETIDKKFNHIIRGEPILETQTISSSDYIPKYRKEYQGSSLRLKEIAMKDDSFDWKTAAQENHEKYNREGSKHTAWCLRKLFEIVESNVDKYKQEEYEMSMESLSRAYHSLKFYWGHQEAMRHILTTKFKTEENYQQILEMYNHNKKISKEVEFNGPLCVANLNGAVVNLMRAQQERPDIPMVFGMPENWRDYKISKILSGLIDDIKFINRLFNEWNAEGKKLDFMKYADMITM